MKYLLFVGAVLAFLMAVVHMMVAKSAIHEIAAYVLFLTAAVLMAGAGIIEAIHRLQKAVVAGDGLTADPHRYPPS